ncbi:MAG: hypothetical protein MJE66_05010, partial [Proteobacteria bacterium]|nr:hypothetical protein [Pseudomonadota bacterium]
VEPIEVAVRRGTRPAWGPGSVRRLAAFLRRGERSPRLAFASEELLGSDAEALTVCGMRAASEVLRSLDG